MSQEKIEDLDIVYLWIDDLESVLTNAGFNFGSKYNFSVEADDKKASLSTTINEKFVEGFFKVDNFSSILNCSAIVGKNGTGKSLLSKTLRGIISGGQVRCGFILVQRKIEEGQEVFYVYNESYRELNVTPRVGFKHKIVPHNSGFETGLGFPLGGGWRGLQANNVIYYSPITDLANTEILTNTPGGIDISSNNLMYEDIHAEESSRPGGLKASDVLTLPRAAAFERQYKMVHEFTSFEFPSGKIKLQTDKVVIRLRELKISLDEIWEAENGWNISIDFKSAIKEINELYRNESRELSDKLGRLNRKEDDFEEKENVINQDLFEIDFALLTLKYFLYNLNRDNTHLNAKFKNQNIDYSSMSFCEAVKVFFENQGIIDETSLILNIDIVSKNKRRVIFTAESSYKEHVFKIPFENMLSMFINELNNIAELKDKSVGGFRSNPKKYIEFDWGANLSSGEKAYMDLYSRLWYARNLIIEKATEPGVTIAGYPQVIYLILDEGELGFHPQWQKEYLFSLLKMTPQIFRWNVDGKLIPSKIQIILTSHSPFLLSDLPAHHVTFLDKNESGVEVKTAFESELGESFGANIHEIFTSGFFLSNGLIGEFSKWKINKLYDYISKDDPSVFENDDQIKDQIKLIGESAIRDRLDYLLNEKKGQQTKDEYIKELEDRIQKLEGKDEENSN